MTRTFEKYANTLHQVFEIDFMSAYTAQSTKKQDTVKPYLQVLFRRWLSSAFVPESLFSPGRLLKLAETKLNLPENTYYMVSLKPPTARGRRSSVKLVKYSLEDHPAVADLKKVVAECTPHIDLTEEWNFSEKQLMQIAKKLTIFDPFYVSYLLSIAAKVGILKRQPSLYVQRMGLAENAQEILDLPCQALLQKIFDASVDAAADSIRAFLPLPVSLFSHEGILELLANPLPSDYLFEEALKALGFDPEELRGIDATSSEEDIINAVENNMDMVSFVYSLGIILDRFLFTPFGWFLKAIDPEYLLPFKYAEDIMEYMLDDSEDFEDEDLPNFLAPCSSFTLTGIGATLLGCPRPPHPMEAPFSDITEAILADSLESAPDFLELVDTLEALYIEEHGEAQTHYGYEFAVSRLGSWSSEKHLVLDPGDTLQDLFEEIAEVFDLNESLPYRFYHGLEENPFVEYKYVGTPGQARGKLPRKHTLSPLSQIDFDHDANMLLVLTTSPPEKFTITLVGDGRI